VGGDQPNELATIVQLDPIWVWFNLSERDVQRVRAMMAAQGITRDDLINKLPIEVGLQTDSGYPYKGVLDYANPSVNQSTGTLQVRGIFENPSARCCRAISCGFGCRCQRSRHCWCRRWRWAATRAAATSWRSTATTWSSSGASSSGRPSGRCAWSPAD